MMNVVITDSVIFCQNEVNNINMGTMNFVAG